ncbi:MAG: adenine deaminase [Phycisphaerales bacterium]|jgi:adenine deaminase
MISRTDPKFMTVCRGDEPADTVFVNGRVVNVFTRTVEPVSVGVFGGRVCAVTAEKVNAAQTIDLGGRFLAPGLIDAHMHVESTMMMPCEFVSVAAPHGTTGVVFDPHEIANVLGVPGIRLLMDASLGLPMNIMFAASSCVPSSAFENSGATLEAADLEPLFDDERVVALAEMMNFPGVFLGDPGVLAKVKLGLNRAIVDGHCPGLAGRGLGAYVGAGISSDHECTTPEEALEKVRLGMQIYLREGSAARNLEALVPIVNDRNASRFCFCTDDRHPGDLRHEGHIDHVVRKAVRLGLDPVTALAMGSLHVADHYRQPDLGAIAPGRSADLIVFEDLADITPTSVYHQGELIAQGGEMVGGVLDRAPNPDESFSRGSVRIAPDFGEASLRIPAKPGVEQIRVIEADPHQLWTEEAHLPPKIEDGRYVADPSRDLLKLAVIARHGTDNGAGSGIGLGFVTGFGFENAALASTVGHDAHNLAVVGDNDSDMAAAARALESVGGGQCVVRDGTVLALLPLPIAGLISDQPSAKVIEQQSMLLAAVRAIGCPVEDPFMPLSFLPLPVIPKLKLTDLGLVDVLAQRVVPLEVGFDAE